MSDQTLMRVKDLQKYFPLRSGFWQRRVKWVHAVDRVSLDIGKGEVLGIVGESGCGKSTLAQVMVGIYPPTAGEIELDGLDISEPRARRNLAIRRRMQIVFQDPFWSLNPRKMVRDSIGEPLMVHKLARSFEITDRVGELLQMVGLEKKRMFSFPHEFSGGERQRVAIARSLALNPDLLLLDEPTSSIDTISQAEILNLLLMMRDRFCLTYLLISHDLSVIHYLSDRIAVMYLGKVVEIGKTGEIFGRMAHPYTEALMQAVPTINVRGEVEGIQALPGNVPSAINPPPGCRFHPRCYKCQAICGEEEPALREMGDNHQVACYFPNGGRQ